MEFRLENVQINNGRFRKGFTVGRLGMQQGNVDTGQVIYGWFKRSKIYGFLIYQSLGGMWIR